MPQFVVHLVFSALSCLMAPAALSQAQPSSPDDIAVRFVRAWNAHDTEALGRLFAADADWVTASGLHVSGRDKIRAYLAQEHATWAKVTTMKAMDTRVRSVSENVAVVFLQWQIQGAPDAANKEATVSRGNNLFVAMRQADGWSVVAGQVASRRTALSTVQ